MNLRVRNNKEEVFLPRKSVSAVVARVQTPQESQETHMEQNLHPQSATIVHKFTPDDSVLVC